VSALNVEIVESLVIETEVADVTSASGKDEKEEEEEKLSGAFNFWVCDDNSGLLKK
jgi:hypothetical protein